MKKSIELLFSNSVDLFKKKKKHRTAQIVVGPYGSENRDRFQRLVRFLFFNRILAGKVENTNKPGNNLNIKKKKKNLKRKKENRELH